MVNSRRQTFDLDALRSFVLGVEMGSFARAAERVSRSTSAVSAHLKKLQRQVGAPILEKSGRGLVLTPTGEILLAYARRILELNDEAAAAVRAADLDGCVRVGLQEDFAERLLPAALGCFARAHPRVRIEARVARNAELLELVTSGRLDLALAWDSGSRTPHEQFIAEIPLRWIGAAPKCPAGDEPVPLVVFEPPCLMRSAGMYALDHAGVPWRVAVSSASLNGVWAAVGAGLGVTVRTMVGLPSHFCEVEGLPDLPPIGLILHQAESEPAASVRQLSAILLDCLEADLGRLVP